MMPNLRLTLFLLLQLVATCFAATTNHHARCLTTAGRLKRGLPLKAPVFRRGTPTRRDSSPSSVTGLTTYTGRVQILDAKTDEVVGWLTADGSFDDEQSRGVKIQLSGDSGSTSQFVATCLSCSKSPNLGLGYNSASTTDVARFLPVGKYTTFFSYQGIQYEPQAWSFDSSSNALELSITLDSGVTWSTTKAYNGYLTVMPDSTANDIPSVKLKLVPI
ncbi:hypothetical protein DL96DRAFT_876066 [Flagelloscypha sp. PMI_526]|nr:hypothetical protein DL96DRAFT_876066 [Flagelloscypha sp. PMI_526]